MTTMYPGKVNSPATTLSGNYTAGDNHIHVTELAVFPSGTNLAVIGTGEDAVTYRYTDVSAASGEGTLTGVEDIEGIDKNWVIGDTIARNFTNYDYEALRLNVIDIQSDYIHKETADRTIYVDMNAAGEGTGVDWTNAFTTLQGAIDSIGEGDYSIGIQIRIRSASEDIVNITNKNFCQIYLYPEFYWCFQNASTDTGKVYIPEGEYVTTRGDIDVGDQVLLFKLNINSGEYYPDSADYITEALKDTVAAIDDDEITLTTNTTKEFTDYWYVVILPADTVFNIGIIQMAYTDLIIYGLPLGNYIYSYYSYLTIYECFMDGAYIYNEFTANDFGRNYIEGESGIITNNCSTMYMSNNLLDDSSYTQSGGGTIWRDLGNIYNHSWIQIYSGGSIALRHTSMHHHTTCITVTDPQSVVLDDAAHPNTLDAPTPITYTKGTMYIPDGGNDGQVLAKSSSSDFEIEWITPLSDHGALTGLSDDDHPQYIKHSLAATSNDFLVASGVGVFIKKTLAEVKSILGLGSAAYTSSGDYAVAAKGVTNGDSHDHAGGDGAQIDHGGLGGLSDDDHTIYIKHALATAANDSIWASGSGTYVKKTLAEAQAILVSNTPKRSIILTAAGGFPLNTGGCAANTKVESSTNKINYYVLDFDKTTSEAAAWTVVMPDNYDGGTVTAVFYWTATSSSGGVVWALAGRSYINDDAIDQAQGTIQQITDTLIATGDVHVTSATPAITIAGTPAGGCLVQFRVTRLPADGDDTLAADARLIAVKVEYGINAYSD